MEKSATRITATELVRSLSDMLSRVKYRGEGFVIERNGEAVASLAPPETSWGISLQTFVERIKDIPMPGDDFADDLEDIVNNQGDARFPEWPNS